MVMDTRAELAQDLGERYGVPWTDRVEVLLANPAVDAVYIAVPHYLHAPLTIQAAEAGKRSWSRNRSRPLAGRCRGHDRGSTGQRRLALGELPRPGRSRLPGGAGPGRRRAPSAR